MISVIYALHFFTRCVRVWFVVFFHAQTPHVTHPPPCGVCVCLLCCVYVQFACVSQTSPCHRRIGRRRFVFIQFHASPNPSHTTESHSFLSETSATTRCHSLISRFYTLSARDGHVYR